MLVRSESTPQDASSLPSDTRSELLTPASDGITESRTNSRKRKREDFPAALGVEDLLSESFTVKPYPTSVHDKPRTLKPLAILARSDLPLAWLDRSSPSNTALPVSRLYEANIKILDLEQRMSSIPSVLIAQLDDKKSIYAIEYDSRGRYVLFKLGSWIDLKKLYDVALVSRSASRPQSRAASVSVRGDDPFFDKDAHAEAPKFSKKKKLAIEEIQAMVRRPSLAATADPEVPIIPNPLLAALATGDSTPKSPIASIIPASQEVLEDHPQPSPEGVLENVRSQYLENLYLSKASTAYFAKGPLSRARATFQLDIDSTFDIRELAEFLRSLVLPTSTLDKKYKDGVTGAVFKIESGGRSDVAIGGKAPRKKRAAKKVKLGKNGLYTSEDALIQQWWENYDSATEVPGTSREASTRSRISQLRIRETQLQMIVILETLQLEEKVTQGRLDRDSPVAEVKTEDAHGQASKSTPPKTPKAKKPQDLPALINIHVDRLSIWQSISAEEGKGAVKSVEAIDEADKPTSVTDKHAADILRDFCVEVIVPFFAANLPIICDTICRKLGGPKIVPSAKTPIKATVAKPGSRPGAATKRAAPRESKPPSLQRLLTEDRARSQSRPGSRGQSRAISLMRSATAPIVPGLKREISETPSLSTFPSADSQGIVANRAGVQTSKKFSRREVDLSYSALIDPVAKKANMQDELKAAIAAMKRPDRNLAGQSMAELAEKRAAAASQSRKAKKPVRNPLFDGVKPQAVQIHATPKANRHRDMMKEPELPRMYGGGHGHDVEREPSMIPPSSVSRVPSSGPRHGNSFVQEPAMLMATPMKRWSGSRRDIIEATPTRKTSVSRSSFAQSISAAPARGPSFSRSMNAGFQAATMMDTVADTPARSALSRDTIGARSPQDRSRSGAPPSPSPPKRQRELMEAPFSSRRENIFETPQKTKTMGVRLPETPEAASRSPLKALDFGKRKGLAGPATPVVPLATMSQAEAPRSSTGDNIYTTLGWDNEDEL